MGSFGKSTTNATANLKKMNMQSKTTGSGLASLAKKAVGVVAAYASFKQIVSWGKECIDAANVQANAEKRLETLMMNVKGTTLQNVDAMKKYASELQGVTTVGDEVTIQGASQLATFQLQNGTIKTLLPSLQDLAVSQYGVAVSSDQMQSMANLVGKVMTGSVSALTRYGVTLSATQKKILQTGNESQRAAMLVEVLKQNFGGLSEAMANTPEGRIQQLKNAWGDMQEVVGAKLYPVVTDFLGYMTTKIPTIQNAVTTGVQTITPVISDVFHSITSFADIAGSKIMFVAKNWQQLKGPILAAATAIGTYKVIVAGCNAVTSIQNGLNTITAATTGMSTASLSGLTIAESLHAAAAGVAAVATTVFGAAMAFLTSPIFLVVAAIGAVIAIGVLLYKNWDTIKAKAGMIGNWISEKWNGIKNATKEKFNAVKDAIGGALDGAKSYAKGKLANIKQAFDLHGGGIKGAAAAAMEGVKQYYSVGYDALNALTGGKLGNVVNCVREKLNSAKETASNILIGIKQVFFDKFEAVKNVVSSAIERIKGFFNFEWSLPKIKMPHFNITGSFSLNPPSTPHFDVSWYKNGGILTKPTIFGTGKNNLLGGGEAGDEAVLPLNTFWNKLNKYISNASDKKEASIQMNLNFYGDNKDMNSLADEVVNTVVPKLKLALQNI